MKRTSIYIIGIAILLLAGCSDQRDLYSPSTTAMQIESDWVPSLNRSNMQEATALFFKDDGKVLKEYFSQPNTVKTRVSHGQYDLLIFNGVMESKNVTNLDHVYFRGTEHSETFEAYAEEGNPSKRLVRSADEYIASNSMELLACAHDNVFIEDNQEYHIKYKDGKNTHPVTSDYIEVLKTLVPRAVSYRFCVKFTNLVNPTSARSASGALRGFAGSVFLVSDNGMPKTGISATHHLNLTTSANGNMRTATNGKVIGTAQTPVFVSFGPPLPENLESLESSGRFTLDLNFLLTDNTEFIPTSGTIDITSQVNEIIKKIYSYHIGESSLTYDENMFVIEIADEIFLPVVKPENIVEVVDWGDDEEILVWIKK